MAVGHVRYGTTGNNDRLNSQPIVVNHHKGRMALAHNGNLVNSFELRQALRGRRIHLPHDQRHRGHFLPHYQGAHPFTDSIEEAVNRAMNTLKGAFSLVVMSPSKLIAARDELGMRPLCYGQKGGRHLHRRIGEHAHLDSVSAKYIRDIEPGEIVIFR